MLPKIILIDEDAPEDGALVFEKYLTVRECNKDKLIEGLKLLNRDIELTILGKKEYLEGLNETYKTSTKAQKDRTDPSNQC